jgi:D-alanyl-D-alanine carboxypeptidase (penicillin-binding protein 5/6)
MPAFLHRLLLSATLVFAPLALAADTTASAPTAAAGEKAAVKTATTTSSKASASKTTASKAAAAKPTSTKKQTAKSQKTAEKKPVAKTATTKKPVAKASAEKKAGSVKKTAATKAVATSSKAAPKIAAAARAPAVNFDELDAYRNVAKAYMVKVGRDIIWEGASETRLPPASLTKMMTALLVLESYRPDDVVEISPEAAAETGSRLGLRTGDRILLADLLAATLIRSANDACHALADWHSGSEAVFVARMNQRAEQLGLRDTHFENACGHDHPDHLTTARDLAVIAETAMNNPTFARIVTKDRMAFRSVDGRRTFRIKTTNHLIGTLDGIQGVKTGFTNGAGPCLVAMAERNGERVWLVLLNARNRWWNATAMIDSAFTQGQRVAALRRTSEKQQAQAATTAPTPASATAGTTALARGA